MEIKKHTVTITLEVDEYTLADTLHEIACKIENAGDDDLSEITLDTAKVTIKGWQEYSNNI